MEALHGGQGGSQAFHKQVRHVGCKVAEEQDKDDTLLWTSFNQMAYSRPINCPWGFDVHFKYHMLMPNTQLENKLTK